MGYVLDAKLLCNALREYSWQVEMLVWVCRYGRDDLALTIER